LTPALPARPARSVRHSLTRTRPPGSSSASTIPNPFVQLSKRGRTSRAADGPNFGTPATLRRPINYRACWGAWALRSVSWSRFSSREARSASRAAKNPMIRQVRDGNEFGGWGMAEFVTGAPEGGPAFGSCNAGSQGGLTTTSTSATRPTRRRARGVNLNVHVARDGLWVASSLTPRTTPSVLPGGNNTRSATPPAVAQNFTRPCSRNGFDCSRFGREPAGQDRTLGALFTS